MANRDIGDEAQLHAIEQRMFDAIRARDADGLRELLHDDFVLRIPGHPDADREALIAGVLAIPGEILSVDGEGVTARVVDGVGVLTGTQRARVALPDGTVATSTNVFTDVAVWTERGWRLVLAHSVELPE
ncbi:MAG TPA: nuclear transport factor 2 family protein [Kofleriaceae bacterium]|jgi:uncharacterized protein (TIGR02246 family)|nr:nuclear transport factor 2 family protein [Kofleriaceae bacterium]